MAPKRNKRLQTSAAPKNAKAKSVKTKVAKAKTIKAKTVKAKVAKAKVAKAKTVEKTVTPEAVAPPFVLTDQTAFEAGLDALARLDGAFVTEILRACVSPALRRRAPGLEGLAWIVVAQQVSTASATAIFGRLKTRLGAFEADVVRATSDEDLRLCGLSAPKMRTLRAIAEAQASGLLDFDALALAKAEAAHQTLIAIKGIGPWTADIFLLFCLGHADAWPAGDLALQEAAKIALGLDARPDTKALQALGERWRPYRGVAAHCLWAYYHVAKARPTL